MNSIEKNRTKTFSDQPFWNLALNVILPVLILKKGASTFPFLSPLQVLALALALPLLVGAWDYAKAKKKNYVSLLGVINTALTGGFAIMEVEGFWFAVKEGTLPLLLGVFVLASLRFKKNFVATFLLQPQVVNRELIDKKSVELNKEKKVHSITQVGTFWFALSFFLSASLNLILGLMVFKPIDMSLPQVERAHILNEQIAQMTWLGYIVIALPLTLGTGILLWWLMKSLANTLDLKVEDLLHHKS